MSRKSLGQERAAFAWRCVQGQSREYKNLAKSLPALIMSNGLMQALAYLKAKEKQPHHLTLGAHVCSWALIGDRERPSLNGDGFKKEFDSMMDNIYKMQSDKYRHATEESLEILKWIRQLADAAISDEKEKSNA